jgi:hypothetical protein
MCRKRVFFRRFDKRLFLWKCKKRHFRYVTSPRGSEHRIPRDQNMILMKNFNFCLESAVFNIVSSKPYPKNLLVAFKFSNSHFHIQNCRFRALFCGFTANQAEIQKITIDSMFTTPWACYIPKMTFFAFPQKKPFIKTSKKHSFSAHLTRLLTTEAKIEKNRTVSLKFRQFSGFSPNLKTFRYKL